MVYAGAAFLGPALLRRDPEWGFTALLFLFAIVWATDIFAYFVRPRRRRPAAVAAALSPKKTWSGAIGGAGRGGCRRVRWSPMRAVGKPGMVGVMALVLSIVAQAGDLFESAVKRRFGAKDASNLIPGHGGVMDRLDGFLVAAIAAL